LVERLVKVRSPKVLKCLENGQKGVAQFLRSLKNW
jgi:hypothetical protein